MKPTVMSALVVCVLAGVALGQQPDRGDVPPPPPAELASPPPTAGTTEAAPESEPPAASESPETAPTETQGAQTEEKPAISESFDARVHRRLDEYNRRHAQRELEIASYSKASGNEPSLERFADPRKVQVELKDELDREQTSEQLAGDYAEQARQLDSKEQAVQEFITKRQKMLDDLSQQSTAVNRQDLNTALTNLALQPESLEVQELTRDIHRRLSEADRLEKELPASQARHQEEVSGATGEFNKLKALQQFYEKESKAYAADALSAHNNRLALADRLEYLLVRTQAEDVLEQGQRSMQSVQHLNASPEVETTLKNLPASAKPEADPGQAKN